MGRFNLYPYFYAFHWLVMLILIGLYFLPASLAWNKKKASRIFSLNLFLGWTLVGWIVAFVWAVTEERLPTKAILNKPMLYACAGTICGPSSRVTGGVIQAVQTVSVRL